MGKHTTPDADGLLCWSEIARRLGWSVDTVQRDYARALVKLRDAMEAAGVSPSEFHAYMRIRREVPRGTR